MEGEIIKNLLSLGYVSTGLRHSSDEPLVVHAVAGSGKTTFLRSLLHFPDVEIFTGGTHDTPNLSGKHIRCAAPPESGKYCILDEYPAYPNWSSQPWNLLIADNLQYSNNCARAHYTCNTTHRLGAATVDHLQRCGFDIQYSGTRTDDFGFEHANLYLGTFHGQVITLDNEAHKLLVRHGLSPLSALATRGLEFDETTVVTTKASLEELRDKPMVYVALTRHLRKCNLRTAHFEQAPRQL